MLTRNIYKENLSLTYTHQLFSLKTQFRTDETNILMCLNTSTNNTSELPETYSILSNQLPSIFSCECFNDYNLPFSQEVQRTELGHLFEHILIEYLYEEKLALGLDDFELSGETAWDWKCDPRGTFYISINAKDLDRKIFINAFEKGVLLLQKILLSTSSSRERI